ncbi:unnamed protein product [Ilex paraguariensis]|uniref:DUF7903 domain-containing protein n=1 Tax=Ilex paraguariensis TaxID=185542 RepID=A0ABC8QYB3_9AQUA
MMSILPAHDDEIDSIRSLVSSATLDPEVKGGLRWRLGKESSGDRYTVVGVWHINAKIYRGSSIRLKIQDADRFDFLSSSGEVTCEVTLKMTSIVSNLLDDEIDSIRSLVSSATLDPEVKGGLRWRLGKESSGDRYTVVGVWHINAKIYRGSSIRLKIRDADRFDFLSSSGEVTCEVTLKMTSIVSNLLVSFFVVVDSVICLCR